MTLNEGSTSSIDSQHCHGSCSSIDDDYDPAWCVCCECCCECMGCLYGPRDGVLRWAQELEETEREA